jgi:hypothetical protein
LMHPCPWPQLNGVSMTASRGTSLGGHAPTARRREGDAALSSLAFICKQVARFSARAGTSAVASRVRQGRERKRMSGNAAGF